MNLLLDVLQENVNNAQWRKMMSDLLASEMLNGPGTLDNESITEPQNATRIMGTKEGLRALRDALNDVLEADGVAATATVPAQTSSGDIFNIHLCRVPPDAMSSKDTRAHDTTNQDNVWLVSLENPKIDVLSSLAVNEKFSGTVWQPLSETSHPAIGDHCCVAYADLSRDGLRYVFQDLIVGEKGIPHRLDTYFSGCDGPVVAWCRIPTVDVNIANVIEAIEIVMPETGFRRTVLVPSNNIPSYYTIGSTITVHMEITSYEGTELQIVEARFIGYHENLRHHRIVVDFTQDVKKSRARSRTATQRDREKREVARAALDSWGIAPDTSALERIVETHRALLERHGALETIEKNISNRRGRIQTETAALYLDGMTSEEMRQKSQMLSQSLQVEIREFIERRIAEAQSLDHYCGLYQRFVQECGHGEVPVMYTAPDGKELGIWIKNIRSLRKTKVQEARLVEMGILPDPNRHQQ